MEFNSHASPAPPHFLSSRRTASPHQRGTKINPIRAGDEVGSRASKNTAAASAAARCEVGRFLKCSRVTEARKSQRTAKPRARWQELFVFSQDQPISWSTFAAANNLSLLLRLLCISASSVLDPPSPTPPSSTSRQQLSSAPVRSAPSLSPRSSLPDSAQLRPPAVRPIAYRTPTHPAHSPSRAGPQLSAPVHGHTIPALHSAESAPRSLRSPVSTSCFALYDPHGLTD